MQNKIALIKAIRSVSVMPENVKVEEVPPCPHCGYVEGHLDLKSSKDIADKIEANPDLLNHGAFTISVVADDDGYLLSPIEIGETKIIALGIHKVEGSVFWVIKKCPLATTEGK